MVENRPEEELVVERHVGWEELGRSGLSPSEQTGNANNLHDFSIDHHSFWKVVAVK